MHSVTTIGLDIAKSVFQVHGVDAAGKVVIRRQLKRRYVLAFFEKLAPCLVGIEACASSHHWSRELQALGHTVRRSHRVVVDLNEVPPMVARIEILAKTPVRKDIDHTEPRRPVIRSMLMSKKSGVRGRSSAPRTVFT